MSIGGLKTDGWDPRFYSADAKKPFTSKTLNLQDGSKSPKNFNRRWG